MQTPVWWFTMATDSAMNSDQRHRMLTIYQGEVMVPPRVKVEVKPEPVECVSCAVCGARAAAADSLDMTAATTVCGTSLHSFLCKFTTADPTATGLRHVCKTCFDLVNVLEQAELEYLKLKETFEAIISKNPLLELPFPVSAVKIEIPNCDRANGDSEDEPLAVTKKKRKVNKKKPVHMPKPQTRKRQKKTNERWECTDCNMSGETGGADALADHIVTAHAKGKQLSDVKKEDSMDGSETSQHNNGIDSLFKEETDNFDDDDDLDDDFEVMFEQQKKKRGAGRPRKKGGEGAKKKENKVLHQCTECDAKYTSLRRLEAHQEKHAGGKPPYICEVCGARYKHKRACDIHVALHKGISDWKCEECNKLFPSKGALQRHNNIHTGKLNYQCDLCGKSFIHTSSFKMHKLSHSGVKPHSCDVCGLALMTRSHLKRHKRIHSGEKRHECRVCGKRFSERYNLMAHAKSHEGAAGGASGAEGPAAARRRLFRCPYCQERYERRYMLERHVSTAHNRTLERLPPTPRNTMSKLLKAQAQARQQQAAQTVQTALPAAHTAHSDRSDVNTPATDVSACTVDAKEERSPEPLRPPALALAAMPHKLSLSSTSTVISSGSWSGAYADFNMRHDFDMRH